MFTMIVISSAALLVAVLGSAVIWGWDALRADEIEHEAVRPADRPALARARVEPAVLRARAWERN